eukprot:6191209-Pleurochrysis_carterae.AAC.1
MFTSGKESLLGQVPDSEDQREWRTSPPDWPTEFITPFPAPYILPDEHERVTSMAERVTTAEHFPAQASSPVVQKAAESTVRAHLYDVYSRQTFLFYHVQPRQVFSSATRGEGVASLSALDRTDQWQ